MARALLLAMVMMKASTKHRLAVAALAMLAAACGSDYQPTGRQASPDGSIIAVSYTRSGGGAAGWCDEKVALIAKDAPAAPALIDDQYEPIVFSVSCGSRIAMQWMSETELKISYAIESSGGVSAYQRRTGFHDRVHLVYVPQS